MKRKALEVMGVDALRGPAIYSIPMPEFVHQDPRGAITFCYRTAVNGFKKHHPAVDITKLTCRVVDFG